VNDLEILEVFHRLTLALAGQHDPEAVLQNALESALALCGGDAGALYLSLENGQLEMHCAVGLTAQAVGTRLMAGRGVTGAVIQNGEALMVNDYANWPGRSPAFANRQRSVISAPLTSGERPIGAITVFTEDRTNAYVKEDLRLLQRFAAFSSVILENARLHERLRLETLAAQERTERRRRVQTTVAEALDQSDPLAALQHLIRGCAAALSCHGGACLIQPGQEVMGWLSDPDVPFADPIRLGEGLIGRVAQTGEALLVNDYPNWPGRIPAYVTAGVKSVIAAPLRRGSAAAAAVAGVIFFEEYQSTAYFSQDDLELVVQVATVASGMLERTRLYTEARRAKDLAERRNAILEAIQEINLELGHQHELEPLLNLLLERAVSLLGGDAGGVYLIAGEEIVLRVAYGDELLERAPLGYGVSGGVAQRGQPILVAEYIESPYYEDSQPGAIWRSVVSVPLHRDRQTVGALTLADTRVAGRFDEEDLASLQRFAALASLALENTTLLNLTREAQRRSERQNQLLESLSQASLELVAQLEPQQMLQQLTERTQTLFSADAGVVYLLDDSRQRFRRVTWHGESSSPSGTFGQGLSGRVMADVKSARVANYTSWEGRDPNASEAGQWRAAMSAPLMRGATAIGALTIARSECLEPFSASDLETLERLSAFASLALEKAQLLDETRQAERAALERLEQLEALDAVRLQLLGQHEPNEVLRQTLRLLMPLLGASGGLYWQYQDEDRGLELRLTENLPGAAVGSSDAFAGHVIETGRAWRLEDAWKLPETGGDQPESDLSTGDERAVYRSAVFAPLTAGRGISGVLALTHEEAGRFSATHLETLERFSGLASVALENARLLERMRRAEARASDRNALLEALHGVNLELGNYVRLQPLLFSILERALLMLGGHDGRFYLRDGDGLKLVTYIGGQPFDRVEIGEGASGVVVQTGQPLLIEDYLSWEGSHGGARRWRSVVAVPLKRGAEVLGALAVVDTQTPGRFTTLDLEALERFAALASLALEKTRLLEDTQHAERQASERARQLEALYQVSLELNGQLEPDQLLRNILTRAAQLLEADAGGVYLNDPSLPETVLAAGLGSNPTMRIRLGDGASGRVALDGAPQLLEDYQIWPGRVREARTTWRSVASVPLRRGQALAGALTVADTRRAGAFKPHDLEVLERFAALASIALENARLYSRERQNLDDERVRARITQEITRLQGVSESAKALLVTLSETLGYAGSTIYLRDGDRLRLQAALGTPEGRAEPPAEIPLARGVNGQVTRTGQAVLLDGDTLDGSTLDGNTIQPDLPRGGNLICLPLKGRDGVLGTLNVHGTPQRPLGRGDLEMLTALGPALSTALENATLHSQLERKARELEFLRLQAERAARYDPLTNLRNRRAFEEDLKRVLERYQRTGQAFGLAVIDLAGFKAINDSLGHAGGDEALRRVARALGGTAGGLGNPASSQSQGGTDSAPAKIPHRAYRIGGDEFLVLIPAPLEPRGVLTDLIGRIQALEFQKGLRIAPNVGLAVCPSDTDDMDRLQSLADRRMYAAKALGRAILEDGESQDAPPRRRAGDTN
jgi:GAF domain-containing protein